MELIVFDMDGVLVDNLDNLYSAYLNFLKHFGHIGSSQEFARLNGPKLSEIISLLRQKYQLELEEDKLMDIYKEKIKEAYDQSRLIKGVSHTLSHLKNKGFRLALASSSSRENVDKVLSKFDLKRFFEYAVTGDDVSSAKPDPEIYEKVRDKFSVGNFFVVEDSINGIYAAKKAGATTILFGHNDSEADYKAPDMISLRSIIDRYHNGCELIESSKNLAVELTSYSNSIPSTMKKKIDSLWDIETHKNANLHNGKILVYETHKISDDYLIIYGYLEEYKNYYYQLKTREDMRIRPLAVSGLVIDEQGNTLIGKRSESVSEYRGFYELVPSGGISEHNIDAESVNYKKQLVEEFEEETNMQKDRIKFTRPIGLILDEHDNVYDIFCKIFVSGNLHDFSFEENSEYSDIQIVKLSDIHGFLKRDDVVPVSKVILGKLYMNSNV